MRRSEERSDAGFVLVVVLVLVLVTNGSTVP
jgi:hypothetical protein